MKNFWLISSLFSSLSVLLILAPAKAAQLESWQFNQQQNQLTFTTDEPVQPRVQLLSDPARLVIDLPNTSLERREDESFDDPIEEVEVRREDNNVTQIVIELDDDYTVDPTQVIVRGTSTTGWTVQLPTPQPIGERRSSRDAESIPISVIPFVEVATIQAVELDPNRNQVLIRADRALQNYTSGWEQSTATYQIQIPNARLGRGVTSSAFDPQSPLLRLQVRQQADSVTVSLQPAPGVQIGDLSRANQTLSLALTGHQQRRFTAAETARAITLPPLNQLPNVSRQRVLIALDPGHGGRDPGAVGIGGLRETDIVLEVGLRVAELLQEHGAEVILTRTDEREIGLEPRVLAANRANADLFVSIHANAISMSRPDVNGVETYFYSSVAAENLATYLQESMLEATNMNSRGVKEARFYVLRRTTMPAALVEVGFVTGAIDARLLAESAFRDIVAQAITRGILQYVVDNL